MMRSFDLEPRGALRLPWRAGDPPGRHQMRAGPRNIDEYLAAVSEDQRSALEKLRQTIRALVPAAEECLSYGVPAFRLDRMLVGFGAGAAHCSFYPMSSTTVEDHRKELAGYDTSKGTIRFRPDRPLPASLVRKLVRARIVENAARGKKGGGSNPKGRGRRKGPPERRTR